MTRFASPIADAPAAEPSAAAKLLAEHLFFDPDLRPYAVLDGAAANGLLALLRKHNPPHVCLYRGELPEDVAEVAPYLVELQPGEPVTQAILSQGWGNHWGIFAQTPVDLREMRKHCRTFLMVNDPDGKPLYFRYYDPRVLRSFLPLCNTREAATIFGPVRSYLVEAEDGSILRLRLHDTSRLPVAEPVTRPPQFTTPPSSGGAGGNGKGGPY
jgi:hypothetical protein